MKHVYFTLLFFGCVIQSINAQGFLRGKITDNNGESVVGAVISLKENRAVGTTSDLDGLYSLKINDSLGVVVLYSSLGYKKHEEKVWIKKGQVIVRDVVLKPIADSLVEVVVSAKVVRTTDNYMLQVKQNSATTIDYVSSETMKKTGDANVASAVARVSGVATNNGGLITVRGIGDRYVKTTLNGSRIPTLDPFTNNFKLDIFPASLIANVKLEKTASPELPGDWAGAYISIETKDYPENLLVDVETSVGYNAQTSFQTIGTTPKSSTDWIGYDNGFRDHNMTAYIPINYLPTAYDEFVSLGLGNYFKSIGVTQPWNQTTASGATYNKLGLIQLGLMSPAQINDPVAYANAEAKFNSLGYHAIAFDRINANAIAWDKTFPNTWRNITEKAPLNFSQTFTIGNQIPLFGHPLGILGSFRYSSTTDYDPSGNENTITDARLNPNGTPVYENNLLKTVTIEKHSWNALLHLAYKYNPNHTTSFIYMPNVLGTNRSQTGHLNNDDTRLYEKALYESRTQHIMQLKSVHYFPKNKIRLEGNASYTLGKSITPDFKQGIIPYNTNGIYNNAPVVSGFRNFSYLNENIFDSRLDAEIPLTNDPSKDGVRKIKFGGAFQRIDRKFDQYQLGLQDGPGSDQIAALNPTGDPFALSNFNPAPVNLPNQLPMDGSLTNSMLRYYIMQDLPTNHAIAYSNIGAGFGMLDYSFTSRVRVAGGLRVEHAFLFADVFQFDSLHLPYNDPRRHIDGYLPFNPGKMDEINYLPSLNILYKIINNELNPLTVRLNYSSTVARPSLRELSSISSQDYELNALVSGNPDLKTTHINNYDMRLEQYFKNGDNASISVFYKDFQNHIELTNIPPYGYFWVNNPNYTYLKGIELEGRKVINKHFDFMGNATFVDSRSTFQQIVTFTNGSTVPGATITHTMFGQAPYVINAILSYHADSIGVVCALSYNIQGPRLVIDGAAGIPDIYEMPRNLLDFKVSKKFHKHWVISLRANNILNAPIVKSYKLPAGYLVDYDHVNYGTNFILSIGYKF